MAINKNHEFEELDGVKCGIVEKNVSPSRLTFLKTLLEYNGYTVIAVPSPAPKATASTDTTPPVEGTGSAVEGASAITTPSPVTYTVGVTDYTFNAINALFGRALKTPDGHIVTPAYWQQAEKLSHDEIPYYER